VGPGQSVEELGLPLGPQSLIGFWLNKGCAYPGKVGSAWMWEPRYRNQFWGPKIRARLAAQVPKIRSWRVIEGDWWEAPDVRATWFIDPPYQGAGRYYRHSTVDYSALGAWCRTRSGLSIVCEQQGADWLPFRPAYAGRSTARKAGKGAASHEVVWLGLR